MLSTPLGFILGLSLHNATPQFMCLKFILALISAEAHSFLLVHYVSDFLFWGVAPCAFLIGFLGWIARFGDQLFSWSVCYAPLRASTMIFFFPLVCCLMDVRSVGCGFCFGLVLLALLSSGSLSLRFSCPWRVMQWFVMPVALRPMLAPVLLAGHTVLVL